MEIGVELVEVVGDEVVTAVGVGVEAVEVDMDEAVEFETATFTAAGEAVCVRFKMVVV